MFTLILLFLPLSIDDKGDLAKERQRFVGTWELGVVKRDGKEEQEPVGGKTYYVFSEDGTYLGKAGNTTLGKGTYKPLLKTKPPAIDWTTASRQEYDGKFGKEYPSVGIYRFEGDTLTIVLKLNGKPEERPADFDNKAGAGHYTIRLQRVKE